MIDDKLLLGIAIGIIGPLVAALFNWMTGRGQSRDAYLMDERKALREGQASIIKDLKDDLDRKDREIDRLIKQLDTANQTIRDWQEVWQETYVMGRHDPKGGSDATD